MNKWTLLQILIELNDDHIINHINFNSKINNIWIIKRIYRFLVMIKKAKESMMITIIKL